MLTANLHSRLKEKNPDFCIFPNESEWPQSNTDLSMSTPTDFKDLSTLNSKRKLHLAGLGKAAWELLREVSTMQQYQVVLFQSSDIVAPCSNLTTDMKAKGQLRQEYQKHRLPRH